MRRGWNASKHMLGLKSLTSHIMSRVYSRPDIDVFISRLGLLESYMLADDVIREINYKCKYSSYFHNNVELS